MDSVLIGIPAAFLILVWAIYAMGALKLNQAALESISKPVGEWLDKPGSHVRSGLWAGAIIVTGLAWLASDTSWLGGLAPELTGLAITVIIIDELGRYRAALQYKRDVLDQIGSNVNDAALEAVRLAKKHGWLQDGSLEEVDLFYANLERANLRGAQMRAARLIEANLQNTTLQSVNLSGGNLSAADLSHAYAWRAIFESANFVGGITKVV